jgi:pyruvate formate lyase activating enzyme
MLRDVKCIRCGNCVSECPLGASQIIDDRRVIDFGICNQCLRCVGVCTARAIECAGEWKSVGEIMDIVVRDTAYYRSTSGGLTLSGGEPLKQWRFARELASAARANGIHVALDTTGYASWKAFSAVIENVDLVLYDLKHMGTAMHQKFTGVPNRVILQNLGAILRETDATVWVRIPVIPAFNNEEETIVAMAAYLCSLPRPIEKISLLPFHQYGAGKYPALGRSYHWSDQAPDPEERIEFLKHRLETFNLNVEIGR